MFRCLSLGGGVQSSVIALMADKGLFDDPLDRAIHADTGWDPPTTLEMVRWLQSKVSYPVDIVRSPRGSVLDDVRNPVGEHVFTTVPVYFRKNGKARMSSRQCTKDYKIVPVEQQVRKVLGIAYGKRPSKVIVEQWVGFSTDEITRVKPNAKRWIKNRYPLIELGLSRAEAVQWWYDNAGDDAPELARSSCVGCPFHTSAEWANAAKRYPEMVEEAALAEEALTAAETAVGRERSYLHRRLLPLREAVALDLEDAEIRERQGVLFEVSDEGICGGTCFT